MTTIQGGCLCGAVRYSVAEQPLVVRACWCRVCQYIAAGSATVNLAFASHAVSLTGELRDFPSTADSGCRMHRRFCPLCGVHVLSAAEERPQLLMVRAGTLDDPAIARPSIVIWTKSAPPWVRIEEGVMQYAGQPPPVASPSRD